MHTNQVTVYTDGSCMHQMSDGGATGAWVALIFIDDQKIVLQDVVPATTHNRMELAAVIYSIRYITERVVEPVITFYTDSQYVVQLQQRKEKLISKNFQTQKGTSVRNDDLVRELVGYLEKYSIDFVKVKAHQKQSAFSDYNREVDKLVRKMLREYVKR